MTVADELIVVERADALKAFNDDKAFEELFLAIKGKADEFEADITNAKGRKELKSFCFKIRKTKARIDEVRTDITEEMRKTISEINARGKVMVERLESLHDDCRKPLTDWEEAEKIRVDTIREVIDNARALGQVKFGETSLQIQERINGLPTNDLDWYGEFKDEAQLVLEAAFNSLTLAKTAAQNAEREAVEREAERKELERLRQEAEERRAQEAAAEAARQAEERRKEQEQREAEQKLAAERAEATRRQEELQRQIDEANRKAEEAEQAAKEANERAARAAEEERLRAEESRLAEQRRAEEAKAAADRAAEDERRAQEQRERKAKAAEERIHQSKEEAAMTLFPFTQSADVARQIVDAIEMGTIPHLRFEA